TLHSLGLGIGTRNSKGDWLEIFYPQPLLSPSAAAAQVISTVAGLGAGNSSTDLGDATLAQLASAFEAAGESELARLASSLQGSARPAVLTVIAEDSKPQSVPEVYLKLHL